VGIALVQINPVIGDFSGNIKKIATWAELAKGQGCRLVIFPEMVVCGYPPQDLLERRDFLDSHDRALDALLVCLPQGIEVMFGCLERRPFGKGRPLYNAAMVARDGEIVYRAQKRLLPSYDVFDESRYFQSGEVPGIYRCGPLNLAVTICEDVWSEEVPLYQVDPVADIVAAAGSNSIKLDAIINISASPFQRDKEATRKAIFTKLCRTYNLPFLYCNQVGAQDSLLFDGRSLVMNGMGEVVAQACGFSEDMIVVDEDSWRGEMHEEEGLGAEEAVYRALVMGVRDYTGKCGFSSVILGLSGGIDSALTAAIGVEALGPDKVLGVALPSPYNSADSLEDARKLAKNLGCRFSVLPIGELMGSFNEVLAASFAGRDEDLTEQNLQARIRGNLLMALSNKLGGLLLTTGNKSEMAVGYCTLYGDMCGGLAVIADVPKVLVYRLAAYVNRERQIIPRRIIDKAPSAELKPGQKDQDDLPPYEILDRVLELYLEEGKGLREIVAEGFDQDMVGDILRRIRHHEYKRKQAPLGLKVTSKAFGYGRRYPNVQNFREE
jgi:NAD+ synthase (glutamine-hydrolysing)